MTPTPDPITAAREALPDLHPADCQCCSENDEPCRTHAEDWRYWQARALDFEEGASVEAHEADRLRARLAEVERERDALAACASKIAADDLCEQRDTALSSLARARWVVDAVRYFKEGPKDAGEIATLLLALADYDAAGGATGYARLAGEVGRLRGVLDTFIESAEQAHYDLTVRGDNPKLVALDLGVAIQRATLARNPKEQG